MSEFGKSNNSVKMDDYYKFIDLFNSYMANRRAELASSMPAIKHAENLARLSKFSPEDETINRLGPRGHRRLNSATKTYHGELQKLIDKLPHGAGKLSEPHMFNSSDVSDLNKSLSSLSNSVKDASEEHFAEKYGDVLDKIRVRGLGYGLSGLGGGALGALIAGKGNRLLGGGIGVAAGLLANYLRRKNYYGKTVKW